jgi:hypothetical protein
LISEDVDIWELKHHDDGSEWVGDHTAGNLNDPVCVESGGSADWLVI